jgi:hypothetical protein
MGGHGSGLRCSKARTSNLKSLDIRQLQRKNLLTSGKTFNWQWLINDKKVSDINIRSEAMQIILSYQHQSNAGQWQRIEYPVPLEWTTCNLGGRRPWFRCPVKKCRRRVAILYGGLIFACRHCHKLAYQCQLEKKHNRAILRADKIRRRLGWRAGIANPRGYKPKGMHWQTFERLKAKHDTYANIALLGMAQWLKL